MTFDFDAAVTAPFRMQPGLRRIAPGVAQLTPLAPGSRAQREKLAVLSAFAPQALCANDGFDAVPALRALAKHAAVEHADAWRWDGACGTALQLGTAVHADGRIEQTEAGVFGLGDEVSRCLQPLPAAWRMPGLLALAFAEDLAIVDAATGTVPWLAVALPSHWAPENKVGRHFTEIHAPVADNDQLLHASQALINLIGAGERWERFVWNVSAHPRLHAHPARIARDGWRPTAVDALPVGAWWRTERQTFIPLPSLKQAIFTIRIDVQPLAEAVDSPHRARLLHAALASMSPAVRAYRGIEPIHAPLLQWLATLQ